MAGAYISGIEMPNGGTIKIEIGCDADGHPMAMTEDYSVYDVIPVPDHGRLGDLDELEKKAPELSEYLSVLAPTVIPADREEKRDGEPQIQVSRFEGQGGRSMTGPCPFPCTNKTEFGYCKTTACIYAPTINVTSMPQQNTWEAEDAQPVLPGLQQEDEERREGRMRLSERFINAIDEDSIISGKNAHAIEDAVNFIRKYEDAEEQGRLRILPCKIGDTVFRVFPKCSKSYIQCPFNGGYGIDRCNNCDAFIKEESFCLSMFEDIGKTVFLTREEAEATLNRG